MNNDSKHNLEELILALINKKPEITLREIAKEAGLSALLSRDRRAIQRALERLIQQNIIQAKGKARARVYIAKGYSPVAQHSIGEQTPIFHSKESIRLLEYIARPISSRKPVLYNHHFLRNYRPNKTFYLPLSVRDELLSIGKVENVTRPAGTYARTVLNRLLIDLSWNSSRLEGNTYSLLETKRLIEFGESAQGKDAAEAQMILNHKATIEYIIDGANEKEITLHEVCSIHALLSENLLGDPSASGRLRNIAVGISETTYTPLQNLHLLKEYIDLYLEKMNAIKDPYEQSFFSLVHLSYLQPFEDVNKRTSRLVSNIPFVKKNLKPLSFIDVSQNDYISSLLGIYEKNDVSLLNELYVWAYRRSAERYSAIQQSIGQPNLFRIKYRTIIQDIIRTIILEEISGGQLVRHIQSLIKSYKLPQVDSDELFKIIEIEIMSLHEGNIARFKIRPSEYQKWKKYQS